MEPLQPMFTTLEHPGDKHLVSEAHLARPTAAVVRILGALELVVRLHWPKGERRWSDGPGGWHWPRPVNCTIQAGQTRANGAPPPRSIQATRLECARGADAAEFWKRCRTRLAVIGEDEAATERNWGVMGANNLMQHALGEVDGWPTLFGGGCCAYPASDHSVVPVPVELRRRIPAVPPAVVACEAEPEAGRRQEGRSVPCRPRYALSSLCMSSARGTTCCCSSTYGSQTAARHTAVSLICVSSASAWAPGEALRRLTHDTGALSPGLFSRYVTPTLWVRGYSASPSCGHCPSAPQSSGQVHLRTLGSKASVASRQQAASSTCRVPLPTRYCNHCRRTSRSSVSSVVRSRSATLPWCEGCLRASCNLASLVCMRGSLQLPTRSLLKNLEKCGCVASGLSTTIHTKQPQREPHLSNTLCYTC